MDIETTHTILKALESNRPSEPDEFDGGVFGDSKYAGWRAAERLIHDLLIKEMDGFLKESLCTNEIADEGENKASEEESLSFEEKQRLKELESTIGNGIGSFIRVKDALSAIAENRPS